MWFILRYLCLATVVLCLEQPRVENVEQVKQSFHFRRAVDGRRDGNHFDIEDDGSYDSYDSTSGYYDSSQVKSGFADIRNNVPGEPGVDYPVYEIVPKTSFSCLGRVQGYYADEEAGCQAFHVCNDVVVSSFICPLGSIFSQQLLTCDWWNKVDCEMTKAYYSSHQGIYADNNEMVQKAFAMMQLPVRNSIKSDSQTRARQMKTTNIGYKQDDREVSGRDTQYYNTNPTREFGVYENFEFGRNKPVGNENTQSEGNIVNFNLRPTNFEANHQGQNSRLNNRARDSSITYIQKNIDYNSQDSYSTLRPSTLGNSFQNSYQSGEKIVRNEYQQMYAPTVPSVTTTTRRFYSPTVPTTYRPSTTSYNTYDQYFQSSDHFYTHSRNLVTPRSMSDYDDMSMDDDLFETPTNQESIQLDKTTAREGQYNDDFPELVQSEESIGIAQGFGEKLNKVGNHEVKESESQTGPIMRSGKSNGQETYLRSSESNLGNRKMQLESKSLNFNSNASDKQHSYQHFYSNLLSLAMKQDEQDTRKADNALANNHTQIDDAGSKKNENNQNFISSRLGVEPLIVQIPRPSGPSGRPVTDIADQLFSFESFIKMTSSTPQTTQPELPPRINFAGITDRINTFESATRKQIFNPQSFLSTVSPEKSSSPIGDDDKVDSATGIPPLISQILTQSTGSGFADFPAQTQTSETPTRIPPLIPQFSQSALSPEAEVSSPIGDDDKTFDSPSRIPPLISQIPQSGASSGAESSRPFDDDNEKFDSPSGIPQLIPQTSESEVSSGAESSRPFNDDNEKFDSPSGIPPLISQIPQSGASSGAESSRPFDDDNEKFDSPSGIPLLIPQTSESGVSSGAESSRPFDDDSEKFDSPSRIPPLISQTSESGVSSGAESSRPFDDDIKKFDSPSGIPPLIPQTSESGVSSGAESSRPFDDDNEKFGSPSRIPPLISQTSESGVSSGAESSRPFDDDNEKFDSPSRIPPLISQIPQSGASSGAESSRPFDDDNEKFDSPSGIPLLIPQTSESGVSSGAESSRPFDDDSEKFDSPSRIPPLISQTSESGVSSGAESSRPFDDDIKKFDSPSRIPPLISQTSESGVSSGAESSRPFDDDNEKFDSPSGIPQLIPQTSESEVSSGAESSRPFNDDNEKFDSPSGIPLLIPQTSESGVSSGAESSRPFNDDNEKFGSPSRIPPLISQIPQSGASSGAESSRPFDDDNEKFDSPSGIPLLIPQTSESGVSSGAESSRPFDDDSEKFDSPSRIPPLISQTSESGVSSGAESSRPFDDDIKKFDSPSRIPPLISQTSESGVSSGAESSRPFDDDNEKFDSPSGIPQLIPQTSESEVSSGAESSRPFNDDNEKFDSPSGIPLLIPQTSESGVSSGAESSRPFNDDNEKFGSPSRIPPLISQTSESGVSSGAESSRPFDDDIKKFDSPSGIPPLISQTSESGVSSGAESSRPFDDDNEKFDSPSRIPPLISQIPQSGASSGAESSRPFDDDNEKFDSPSGIPLLIPQTSESGVSSGAESSRPFDDDSEKFDSPSRIPPLISQTSESGVSSGAESSRPFDDDIKKFDSPSGIPPLIPQTSESGVSSGAESSRPFDDDNEKFGSPSRIPPLISQTSESGVSSGAESSRPFDDDNEKFDLPSRIPPLISQTSESGASSGAESSRPFDDDNEKFDSPSGIPPLIPQTSESAASPGADSSGLINDDDNTFDMPTKIPFLISQISSQSTGTSGVSSANVADRTQTFELTTRVPPLIPQISQSPVLSEAHAPSQIDDVDKMYNTPSRIPPLISLISQSLGSLELDAMAIDDRTQTSELSDTMRPLITQFVTSTESSELESPTMIDDNQMFDPSRIPLLIPQISQSFGSSGLDSMKVDDRTQTSESFASIPPLIPLAPQSSTTSGPQSPSLIDTDNKASNSPSRMPPLITQIPIFIGSSEPNPMNVGNENQTFEFSTTSSPLIPSSSQSEFTSGGQSLSPIGDNKEFDSPSRIPPLIPQFSQSMESSSAMDDDNKTFDLPPKIPLLVSQIPQFVGSSGLSAADAADRTQTSASPTRIPQLISQSSQSFESSGAQTLSAIDDGGQTFDSPSRIPPLISQIFQPIGTSGVNLASDVDDQTQTVESSTLTPRPILNISQVTESAGLLDDNKTFDSHPAIPPLVLQTPQCNRTSVVDTINIDRRIQPLESSTEIPSSITQTSQTVGYSDAQSPNVIGVSNLFYLPSQTQTVEQTFESIGSSKAQSSYSFDEERFLDAPPRIPSLISQISRSPELPGTNSANSFHQKQTLYLSDETPILNPQLIPSVDSSATHFKFQGQYQRPLPFRHFETPTQISDHQFVIKPSSEISAYDSSIEYGSKLKTETTTINSSEDTEDSEDSAVEEFRIHVPDFPPYNGESYYTQNHIFSPPENLHLSGASTSKTLVDQSSSVDTIHQPSSPASSHVEQTPVQDSKLGPNLSEAAVQQSSVTDVQNATLSLLPTSNYSSSLNLNEYNESKSTHTGVETPTLTLSLPNADSNNYNLFKQAPSVIFPISDNQKPISQDIRYADNWAKYNDNLKFTIRGALRYPTQFPAFNAISSTHVPLQSVVSPSGAPGHGDSHLESSNANNGHLSQSGNPSHNAFQESNSPDLFDIKLSGGSNFIPTSSQSPLEDSGYFKKRLETSTPKNVLDTTDIKLAANDNASKNEFSQVIRPSGSPSDLPFGLTHIQPSLNNDDSPYEISFTVNGGDDFDPSGDFITKLLAQHKSDLSLGLEGFGGYEIIKSEAPSGLDVDDVKSTPPPNTKPSEVRTGPLSFDRRGSFDQRSESKSSSSNQNSTFSTSISKTIETHSPRVGLPTANDLTRPFVFRTGQDAPLQTSPNLKSTDFPISKSSIVKSNVGHEQLQDSVNLSKLRPEATDINSSLESLFEFVPPLTESQPLKKEQILEELTKHFGQPLYYKDSQGYIAAAEASRNVEHNAGRQFANLEQYRVGKNDVRKQELSQTNPVPPKPTTKTTPPSVRTFVETEFIPSIGFSFDSDDGRNEYVDAVLKGLLSDNQPVNHWQDNANFYRELREDSASRNRTTKV